MTVISGMCWQNAVKQMATSRLVQQVQQNYNKYQEKMGNSQSFFTRGDSILSVIIQLQRHKDSLRSRPCWAMQNLKRSSLQVSYSKKHTIESFCESHAINRMFILKITVNNCKDLLQAAYIMDLKPVKIKTCLKAVGFLFSSNPFVLDWTTSTAQELSIFFSISVCLFCLHSNISHQ